MRSLDNLDLAARRNIRVVLTDIDDTLTTNGHLTAAAYGALEKLQTNGYLVIPITGRPAGWCDHIARMWPVDAVVGENGAFYFHYNHENRNFSKRFMASEVERQDNRQKLAKLQAQILKEIPGTAPASDQAYREADLAIDFREDVAPLKPNKIEQIVNMFEDAGATAKVSSIHVNGWFGDYDKLTMTRILLAECFNIDVEQENRSCLFVGDSPNDAPMFAYFDNSVGVANINRYADQLTAGPTYIATKESGAGFVEIADFLCSDLKDQPD